MRHRFVPDPKHPQRIDDPSAGKFKVFGHPSLAGSGERRCRVCRFFHTHSKLEDPLGKDALARTRISRFHLVPKGKWGGGGDDVDDNLVPVCGSGTNGHHGMWECKLKGWELVGYALRHSLTDEERAYILAAKGEEWFDHHYPKEVPDGGFGKAA